MRERVGDAPEERDLVRRDPRRGDVLQLRQGNHPEWDAHRLGSSVAIALRGVAAGVVQARRQTRGRSPICGIFSSVIACHRDHEGAPLRIEHGARAEGDGVAITHPTAPRAGGRERGDGPPAASGRMRFGSSGTRMT